MLKHHHVSIDAAWTRQHLIRRASAATSPLRSCLLLGKCRLHPATSAGCERANALDSLVVLILNERLAVKMSGVLPVSLPAQADHVEAA